MEQNLAQSPKNKLKNFIHIIIFILKKTTSKRKLILDLNMIIKRSKIAGKSLHNFIVHRRSSAINRRCFTFPPPQTTDDDHQGFEFGCKFKKHVDDEEDIQDKIFVDPDLIKALEMLTGGGGGGGGSPVVRQLRVTDSPFPVSNGEEDSYVDDAAERFIMKFYSDLRRHD